MANVRALEVPEQGRHVLHLIDDHWWRVASKEDLRLFFGLLGFGREVEGYELVVWEEPSKGRSLAGLAGAVSTTTGRVRADHSRCGLVVFTSAKYPIGTYICSISNWRRLLLGAGLKPGIPVDALQRI